MVCAIREFVRECVSIFRCVHISADGPRQRALSLPMIQYHQPLEPTLARCKSFNQALSQQDPTQLDPQISTEALIDAEFVMEAQSVVETEDEIKSSANLPYDPLALHPVTFDVDDLNPGDAEASSSSPLVQEGEANGADLDFDELSFRTRMVSRNSAILVPTYLPPPRRLLSSPLYSIDEEDEPRHYLRGMAGRERLD
ncbi:hypothetical protein CKAH01_12893 [Colletotrichum kahawae]|uniref:Uncharacterized protein n=1 Tax=Colletotrichum kahawae TaxID=34407 RepID=A0AAD9YS44_COLKA|nr:hypothetical protein CKAH01_12893 [Colletotrichum kahawae]